MEKITSRKNQYIKAILDGRRRKGQWADSLILEGENLYEELMQTDWEIEAVFVSESFQESHKDLQYPSSTFLLPDSLFSYISATKSPQGILLIVKAKTSGELEDFLREVGQAKDSITLLALENVQDPGNVGTLIRSAYAFAIDAVILLDSCANPYQEKVLRASMGGVLQIPLFFIEESSTMMEILKSHRICTLATAFDGENLYTYERKKKLCIVLGNEGHGLKFETISNAQDKVTIPMPGGAESLNVASAGAIVMYQLQEGKK